MKNNKSNKFLKYSRKGSFKKIKIRSNIKKSPGKIKKKKFPVYPFFFFFIKKNKPNKKSDREKNQNGNHICGKAKKD